MYVGPKKIVKFLVLNFFSLEIAFIFICSSKLNDKKVANHKKRRIFIMVKYMKTLKNNEIM